MAETITIKIKLTENTLHAFVEELGGPIEFWQNQLKADEELDLTTTLVIRVRTRRWWQKESEWSRYIHTSSKR